MLNILIIDDEAGSRQVIADIVNLQCPDAKVVGFSEDVKSGIAAIEKYKPDVLLLDINLPDGTGFDLLTGIQTDLYNFHVIFVTAHEQYAIKAIKFSAIDYVLKPVNPNELLKALEKCKTLYKDELKDKIETYSNNFIRQESTKKLVLKTMDNMQVVEINNIIRCESDNTYSTFYTTDNRKIVVSQSIKEYEKMLTEFGFFRIHKSHLINLNHVVSFEKGDGGSVIMKDKSSIPVSFRKKDDFINILKEM